MTARHRNGQFAARPVREAAPLFIALTKCERVAKGNRTRAANYRARVLAVAAMLRAEIEGRA